MITQKTTSIEGQDFTFNSSDLKCNWVLIHNGVKALIVEDVSTKNCKLETRNTIFEADTYEECLVEILSLKLIVEDEDIAADLKLLETPIVKKEINEPSNLLDRLKNLSAAKL